jgi:hypothetical protein
MIFQQDKKYYITICGSCTDGVKYIHAQILKVDNNDYITIQVTESGKDTGHLFLSSRSPITIPLKWIIHAESLQTILDTKTIDDVIYTIDQYL